MRKKGLLLILILVIGLVFVPVQAKGTKGFFAGEDVTVNEDVNSSLFAAGNSIDVDANVDGNSFVAGSNIKLKGSHDSVFLAGQSLTITEANLKDAFIAGQDIKIEDSVIRDLYVAGEKVKIISNIERNLYVAGSIVTIDSTINGDAYIAADNIKISDNAVITGTLKYPSDATITIGENVTVGKTVTYTSNNTTVKPTLKTIVVSKVSSLLSLLFTGLILLYGYNKLFKEVEKTKFDADVIIKTSLKGFIVLVVLPIVAIIAMCTGIALPIALIALVAYFVIIYLSSIITAYYVGHKYLKKKIDNQYLLLIASLICLFIIKLIPYIGGLVGFISLCFGLGFLFDIIKPNPTKSK